MPNLNYRIPSFEFLIDAVDFAPYLLELSLSPGTSEINALLNWSGDFSVAWTMDARNAGFTEAQFSEISTPTRWRKGLAAVTLTIAGYTVAKLRIENYRYNPATRTGQGTLTQLIELLNFDRPALEVEGVEVGAGTSLSTAVNNLLLEAGKIEGTQVVGQSQISIGSLSGEIDARLVTQKPIEDAQRLCGINWNWLYVNGSEVITTAVRPETSGPPLFYRSLKEVEWEPATDNINFACDKVIVTGSRQKAVPPAIQPATDDGSWDEQGRPKFLRTKTQKTRGELYPKEFPGSSLLVVAEIKEVEYFYSPYETIGPNGLTGSKLIKTVTTVQKTLGEIFPTQYPGAALLFISERTTESETEKKIEKTLGELYPSTYPGNSLLTIAYIESLTSGAYPGATIRQTTKTDPKTGGALALEAKPDPEPDQIAPEYNLETETFKGEYNLEPVGWNTFLPRTKIENIGFLPSQEVANNLARQIAIREIQRRDAINITMPIPIEWLAAGCPPFAVCHIHDAALIIDNPIITIAEGRCQFSFTGDRMGTIPTIPVPAEPPVYIPVSGLQAVPHPGIRAIVGVPL